LEYVLANEPDNVRRVGHEYRLRDHDSLTMSNGKWHWNSRGIGGSTATALNFLIEVRGYSFVEAVERLAGKEIPLSREAPRPRDKPPPVRDPLALPRRNKDNRRVVAYLRTRGLDKALIHNCIDAGLLYESAKYHNCVFVGRDERGKARYAALRGTMDNFKYDADGSDKSYGFTLPPLNPESVAVAVFESPIDALSHKILCPDFDGWRLSLGGTELPALTRFLEVRPNVKCCLVCTDNDEGGEGAAAKIADLPGITVTREPPPFGKDWNETLMEARRIERLRDRIGGVRSADTVL
jgi:hypothetical protein